jgi:hypothetical protein
MSTPRSKPLMRSLGEFFGHIIKAVKADPGKKKAIRKTVEEDRRGNLVLRRTTIEEIEFKSQSDET